MKFKAGDKVRVIGPKLTTDSIVFSLTGVMWVESMMNEIGKVHVIKRVVNRVGYKIDDGLDYTYSEEWLEPIADKTEQSIGVMCGIPARNVIWQTKNPNIDATNILT